MLKASEFIRIGLAAQSQVLSEKLRENFRKKQMRQAMEWASIPGVKVNYSFFEREPKDFSREEVVIALADLGIDIKNVKGKKWYEFSKNKWDTKLLNAIKQINN